MDYSTVLLGYPSIILCTNLLSDERQSQRLNTKMAALNAVTNSSESLRETFADANKEQPGAHLVSWNDVHRTMQRRQRNNYPPPPLDSNAANEFMMSGEYRDKSFSMFYQGTVSPINLNLLQY